MKARLALKWLLIAAVLCLLLLIVSVIASVGIMFVYPRLGRITDFQPLRQTAALTGTNYTLELIGSDVLLRNTATQSSYITMLAAYPADPLLYTVLRHRDSIYLIAGGVQRGGNIGGYWFEIYNITNEPYSVQDDKNFAVWNTCTYPRLDGDALEFETAHQCDAYPLFAEDQRFYTVALQ